MNVSFYIAKRYLYSKSKSTAINIISSIAALGIVVTSAMLFVVLSGFAGLKSFTLEFTTVVDPDFKVEAVKGKSFLFTSELKEKLHAVQGVKHYSKIVEDRVIIAFDDKNYPVYIKGVDSSYQAITSIDSVLTYGNWLQARTNQLVTGLGVSNILSLGVLDYSKHVDLFVPKAGTGQITSVKKAFNSVKAVNVGIFDINENLNDSYVYAPIQMAQHLLSYDPERISSIEFKIKEDSNVETVRKNLQNTFGANFSIKDRIQLNDALYKMLNTENLMVYLIATLILVIALFNVVGSIIMMILDKKESLKTLYNLGVTVKEIRRIFFFQGSLLTSISGVLGLLIGLLLIWMQQTFSLFYITTSLPWPVDIKFSNILLVLLTVIVLALIASKTASGRITKSYIES